MLEKIVVLLDGSTLAKTVLPHARALAGAFQARITLLHVLEPQKKPDTGRLDPLNWHLRKIEAQSFLDAVAQEGENEGMAINTILLEGTAARSIVEYLDETEPDLIMLSSHGQGGLSPWNVSSVAQKIIYRVFRSFMLVRAYQHAGEEADEIRYGRIAVPLDGSKRAEYTLPFAARLAEAHDAELVLLHALTPPPVMQRHTLTAEETAVIDRLSERNQAEAEQYLNQIADQQSPQTMARCLSGPSAADVLLDFVNNEENGIDLVIMSAHGYSSETIRPYGSVVSSFIAYGSTTLLILQDLAQDEIRPTQAELSVAASRGNGRIRQTNAYAQPADWSSEE